MWPLRDPRLRVAGVALLLIAYVGYLIGYDNPKSAHKPAALTSSISSVASLEHPPSWQNVELPQEYEVLASSMRQPLILSQRGRSTQGGLVVGVLKPSDRPLPTTLLTRVTAPPHAEVVAMITAQAYRYRDLTMISPHLLLTAYAVPVGKDQEALELCYARSAAAKVQHECEQIAEGLAAQSESVELTPYGRVVGVLRSVIPRLLAQRLAIRRQMHVATSGPALADLAARMATTVAASATRLDSLLPRATSGKVIANLSAALRVVQRSYAAYAHDVLAEQASGYPLALSALSAAESRLQSALESLGLIGY
jgi:hypothetical protein